MRLHEDWPAARDRLTALWRGERLDRPCMAVTAPAERPPDPVPPPPSAEARWLDPSWVPRAARASIEGRWWGGESVPSFLLMAGWVVCLGGTPRFADDTIWFEDAAPDFDSPPPWRHDENDPWVARHRAVYEAMAREAGWDDFLLGSPLLLPACDLLSMHMGATRFLTALLDHPDWMRAAILQGADGIVQARSALRAHVEERHAYWYGNAGWMPFWAPEPFFTTQSDVSCMLSPGMFEAFVLPELEAYHRAFGPVWYHLDGCDATQHLPCLLSLPWIRVVQYTPTPAEPPNGPEHLPLYRRIQSAGKIVHIAVAPEAVAPLRAVLDPSLLMLDVACASVEDARRLLA